MPGLSMNMICPFEVVFIPIILVLVVWGLSETIATFCPIILLRSVDFPVFGLPIKAT
jgi:ABC-type glycerol-3-phosphate transport system permease component